jgi:hypothetical protein
MIHNGSRAPMAFVDIDTANKFSEDANPGYTEGVLHIVVDVR